MVYHSLGDDALSFLLNHTAHIEPSMGFEGLNAWQNTVFSALYNVASPSYSSRLDGFHNTSCWLFYAPQDVASDTPSFLEGASLYSSNSIFDSRLRALLCFARLFPYSHLTRYKIKI